MAKPTVESWAKLKRPGRYLHGNGRVTTKYAWQGEESAVTSFSDSDWAGCRVTAKSTSGGVIMIGGHFIKGWSRTQNHITLSSAEAELIALVKCSAELLGVRSMLRDFGRESAGGLYAASSAALAIARRNEKTEAIQAGETQKEELTTTIGELSARREELLEALGVALLCSNIDDRD